MLLCSILHAYCLSMLDKKCSNAKSYSQPIQGARQVPKHPVGLKHQKVSEQVGRIKSHIRSVPSPLLQPL